MGIHFLVMENSWNSYGKSLLKKNGHPTPATVGRNCRTDKFLAWNEAINKCT